MLGFPMPRSPMPRSPMPRPFSPARVLTVLALAAALSLVPGARSLFAGTTDEAAPAVAPSGGAVTEPAGETPGGGTPGGETPGGAPAAPAAPVEKAQGDGGDWTLWHIMQLGGWMMYILYAISIITVALIAFHFLSLTRGNVVPAPFVAKVRDMLEAKRFTEAALYCSQHRSAIASIVSVGLENSSRKRVFVIEAMGSEGSRQAARLWQQISYLTDITVVAPMCGLLGTVTGMLWTFRSLHGGGGLGVGQVNLTGLAGGIFQAIITTVAGLIIGIIAMVFYTLFRSMVQSLVVSLEETSDRLADLIARGE